MNNPHILARERHEILRKKLQAPSLTTQLKTALISSVKFINSGFRIASKETINRRNLICIGCEFWDSNAFLGKGRCLKCGCSSAKLKIAGEKCPVGKWQAELT